MKNSMTITNNVVQQVTCADDGTNRLFINDTEIPSTDWIGSGSYTYGSITIDQISDLSGNIQLSEITATHYALVRTVTGTDISGDVVNTFDTYSTEYPDIEERDTVSTLFGKIKKFLADLKSKKLNKLTSVNDALISISGEGTAQYCKFAELTITNTYANFPIVIQCAGRGRSVTNLQIMFNSTSDNDPTLSSFTSNGGLSFFIKKTATSKWSLYHTMSETWGRLDVFNVINDTNGKINVTLTSELLSALPSDCTQATYGWSANYANSAGTATKDGGGNTISSTYLKLSGGTMTGALTTKSLTPSGTVNIGSDSTPYNLVSASTVSVTGGTLRSGKKGASGTNSVRGRLYLYPSANQNDYVVGITPASGTMTESKTIYVPLKGGTLALTSDIHTVQSYTGTINGDTIRVTHNLGLGTSYKPIISWKSGTAILMYGVKNITTNYFDVMFVDVNAYQVKSANNISVTIYWTY